MLAQVHAGCGLGRMVAKGNITAQDAVRHAEALNQVRVRKKGDAQRILLMNMVKVRSRYGLGNGRGNDGVARKGTLVLKRLLHTPKVRPLLSLAWHGTCITLGLACRHGCASGRQARAGVGHLWAPHRQDLQLWSALLCAARLTEAII